jgi:hypothetical protein
MINLIYALTKIFQRVCITIRFRWTGYTRKPAMSRKCVYFSDAEIQGLQDEFSAFLDRARKISGVPYIITSGYRTPGENAACGGVEDSSHEKGLAVDLRSHDSNSRYQIIKGLIMAGATRIGFYTDAQGNLTHIHVDVSPDLPQNVMWSGISH